MLGPDASLGCAPSDLITGIAPETLGEWATLYMSNMENIEDTAENWENGSLGMDEKYVKKSKITMEDIKRLNFFSIEARPEQDTKGSFNFTVSLDGEERGMAE